MRLPFLKASFPLIAGLCLTSAPIAIAKEHANIDPLPSDSNQLEEAQQEASTGILGTAQSQSLASWFRSGGGAWPSDVDWPELGSGEEVDQVRKEIWSIYRDARRLHPASEELGPLPPLLSDVIADAKAGKPGLQPRLLTLGEYRMPFLLLRKEEAPVAKEGRALFICMHGGGRNPEAEGPHSWPINTREWQSQVGLAAQIYAGEGIFFVPRMADDRLGRWPHAHNQDAFDTVIEHGIREWDVDPNRVYLMGISEGCYGTQILGPFMPDRFAGASAMAGGVGADVPVENLRNLPFRTDVGENDTTFNRVGLAREYHARMDELAKTFGGYTHSLNVQKGKGHGVDYSPGPAWMIAHQRRAFPDTIVWTAAPLHGKRRPASYWLGFEPGDSKQVARLVATLKENVIDLTVLDTQGEPLDGYTLSVMLNDKMVNLDKPITVQINTRKQSFDTPKRSIESLARTLNDRGDPNYAFPVTLRLQS